MMGFDATEYITVQRMSLNHHGQQFDSRILKSTAIEMEVHNSSVMVFDQHKGTVKAYHIDVWREAYAVTLDGAA